jgi:hypothetical protein
MIFTNYVLLSSVILAFLKIFVIHRRRRFCHVGELSVENEINVLNLRNMFLKKIFFTIWSGEKRVLMHLRILPDH